MKYNQNDHKEFVYNNLVSILESVGMDTSNVDTITFANIRRAINDFYPPVSTTEETRTPAQNLIIRKRKQLVNNARYTLYAYKTIIKREQNV
jgi:hypothetical protein